MKINLGEILTKAWEITWKFKVLWIFGILAGCGTSNGNRFNYNSSSNGGGGGDDQLPEAFRRFQDLTPEKLWPGVAEQYTLMIVAVLLGFCLLWLLFSALGVMGKVGLIQGANRADQGAESLTFGEIWTESLPYFWRTIGLGLLVGLPFFLLIVILLVGLLFVGFSAFGANPIGSADLGLVTVGLLGLLGVLLCVVGLLSLIVGLIVEQAQNALILEDLGILESLGRGWQVFKANLLSVIVMAILLGVLNWVVGFGLALPALLIVIPAAIGVAATQDAILPLAVAGVCCLFYLPLLLVLSGILQTYIQSAWTLTYRRLTDLPQAVSPEPELGLEA